MTVYEYVFVVLEYYVFQYAVEALLWGPASPPPLDHGCAYQLHGRQYANLVQHNRVPVRV